MHKQADALLADVVGGHCKLHQLDIKPSAQKLSLLKYDPVISLTFSNFQHSFEFSFSNQKIKIKFICSDTDDPY